METTHPAVTVQVEFWAQTMIGQFPSISKDITHPCICLSPVHLALVRLEQYHDQVQYPEINAAHASPVSSPYLFFWQPWYSWALVFMFFMQCLTMVGEVFRHRL